MKKIPILLLSTLVLNTSQIMPLEETFIGADFSSGIYAYQLMDKFYQSPNTIEAWVRLGFLANEESGGVIFGNTCSDNKAGTKVEVNSNRNIVLFWNGGESQIIFDKYVLESDDWNHIAVVRDTNNNNFALYVNGSLVQKINKNVGTDCISDYKYIVGGDWSNWMQAKNPFKGEIAQVTVYNDSLTSREVYQDFNNSDEISYKTRDNLLFNGEFTFDCLGSNDTSRFANHATLRSNDYLYEGELYEAEDYALTIIPDPQILTNHRQDLLKTLSQYLIEHKESQKLDAVICVGDNTDGTGKFEREYTAIKKEYDNLKEAGLRWMTTPGNHDYDNNVGSSRALTEYNKYFPYDEISQYSYFGGAYKEGETQNAYYLLEMGGVKYLFMSLEFGVDDNALAWANEILPQYPDHRVILFTHGYLTTSGERMVAGDAHCPTNYGYASKVQVNNPDQIFDKFVRKHKNMFMVFCGHIPCDDIKLKEDVGDNGNVIMSFLIDAQGVLMTGGESMVSFMNFDELNQRISVNFVTTTSNRLYNIQNQFTYSFKGHTDILSSMYYDADGNLLESSN